MQLRNPEFYHMGFCDLSRMDPVLDVQIMSYN